MLAWGPGRNQVILSDLGQHRGVFFWGEAVRRREEEFWGQGQWVEGGPDVVWVDRQGVGGQTEPHDISRE